MAVSKRCKQLLCLLYVVFLFISGVLLVISSILLGYKLAYYFKMIPSECMAPFIIILLMGLGHIILTWLGIKGSRSEHLFYIFLFMAITFVFIVSEIAVAIWAMVLKGKLNEGTTELMRNSFAKYVTSEFDHDALDWDRLHKQFQCCGIDRSGDYKLKSIPLTCCEDPTTDCVKIYRNGCKDYLVTYTKQLLLYIGLTGFGSVVFQVLGFVAFYYFYKAVKLHNTEEAKRRASMIQEVNPLNRQQSGKPRNHSSRPKELPSKA